MLGFPIRTPPDHSSVANSPGLIAGSYVLHRLLMPRHPPCALHSLSHKHNTTTTTTKTRTNTPTTHTPKGARAMSGIDARCSRPLCRSQTTNPPSRPPHPPARQPPRRPRRLSHLILQDPTVCQPHPTRPQPPGSTPNPPTNAGKTGSTETVTTHQGVLHRRFH